MCFNKNFNVDFFLDTFFLMCQTWLNYYLPWGLVIHTSFDDLDFVSRSQMDQKCKLQIVFFLNSFQI